MQVKIALKREIIVFRNGWKSLIQTPSSPQNKAILTINSLYNSWFNIIFYEVQETRRICSENQKHSKNFHFNIRFLLFLHPKLFVPPCFHEIQFDYCQNYFFLWSKRTNLARICSDRSISNCWRQHTISFSRDCMDLNTHNAFNSTIPLSKHYSRLKPSIPAGRTKCKKLSVVDCIVLIPGRVQTQKCFNYINRFNIKSLSNICLCVRVHTRTHTYNAQAPAT